MDTDESNNEFAKGSPDEKFAVLTNACTDCIKFFNLDNKIEFMSPSGLKEHGFKSLKDAIGFDWTLSVVPEQRAEITKKMRESVRDKKTVTIDVKHLSEFADREWCNISISPVFNEDGEVKYFLGISRDISDRKNMEEKIKRDSRELEAINEFMADREARMVELKKENAELKKQLEDVKKADSAT